MKEKFLVVLLYFLVTKSPSTHLIYSVKFLVFNILNINFLNLKAVIIVKMSLSCDFKGRSLPE